MRSKIYIGIDPDLRLLNAAVVTDDMKLLGVFLRRNKEGKDDVAVENSVKIARELCLDVMSGITSSEFFPHSFSKDGKIIECSKELEIILCIESQNADRTRAERARGNNVRPGDILNLAQVTGCLMGAFSNLVSVVHLLQPMTWKKTMTDKIVQSRAYKSLDIQYKLMGGKKPYCVPVEVKEGRDILAYSHDKINPGDFSDICDSIALAVYGAKNNL